jgi:hypothetical protein
MLSKLSIAKKKKSDGNGQEERKYFISCISFLTIDMTLEGMYQDRAGLPQDNPLPDATGSLQEEDSLGLITTHLRKRNRINHLETWPRSRWQGCG